MNRYFSVAVLLLLIFISYQTFMIREETHYASEEINNISQFVEETYFNTNEAEERLETIENQLLLLENITRNVR